MHDTEWWIQKLKKLQANRQEDLKVLNEMLERCNGESGEGIKVSGCKGAADFLENHVELDEQELPDAYYYTCLPLCLLDAIYSIGVHYTSVKNVVDHYCRHLGIEKIEKDKGETDSVHTISEMIAAIETFGATEDFAAEVLKNRQRTSSKNGILKIDAVLEVAKLLKKNGIETRNDFNANWNAQIEEQYKAIKGQQSGISLNYLKMLCGDENEIKPDRHIVQFLTVFWGSQVNRQTASGFMKELYDFLKKDHECLTLRCLDYIIWDFMRNLDTPIDNLWCTH